MSKIKWTKEQEQAIEEKNSNILVAAAAGSGKTAVLVERIIHKIIDEKVDIDKLLVVTFTNAAASEMRERVLDAIYKKLEENTENENLQRQITLLNKASISTIDSFCLEVVRNYFYELENISPNFRIGDTTEIELLKQDTIEDIFEKKYEEENEDFIKLINTYTSYKDDTPLKELILKIYAYIQSNPFPQKWLKEKVEMFNLYENMDIDFSETKWGKVLLEQVEEELIDDISILKDVEENLEYELDLEKFSQTIRDDIDKLQTLKNHLNNWDEAYQIYQNITFTTWPRQKIDSELKDQAKNIRDDVKKKIAKTINQILICNSKEANQDIYDMYGVLNKLQNLILEFDVEFSKRKREKNIVDFNDIEHLALQILSKEEIAKKYQNKYEEIAIDEYQDSNLVQEYILTSVSKGNNIFMVGDVKQSIYKFRQAMPELFLQKYDSYKNIENREEKDNLKIKLFQNFRSRNNVLKITNILFENIMSNLLGDIEYDEGEYLNLGADYPEEKQNLETEMFVINTKQETKELTEETKEESEEDVDRIEDIELEAKFVANKIKNLVDKKFQIWDRKNGKYRNIEYRDIVVLLRATSTPAPIFEQAILDLEIPVFSDTSQEYLGAIEIQTIMNLLKIIDNPMQDIPLVTVLRSQIGKFTDNDLVQVRLTQKNDDFYTALQKAKIDVDDTLRNKIETFINKLNKWRKEQEYLALDEFLWKLYADTGYYNYVGLMPNGELRQANLKMLFERAKQYETASFKGLYNFIHFIEKLTLSSGDLGTAKIIGENDNVVRVMSIHKSKGLEFPVVFLANTGKQFNLMDLNQNVLLHQDMGIGVKYINYEKQVQYDTLSKTAIKSKIFTETLSEEMRILYVALTRAKEKLFITATSKDYEKSEEKMLQQVKRYEKSGNKINPILVKKYKKYMDWILLTYYYEQEMMKNTFKLNIISKDEVMKNSQKVEGKEINVIEKLDNYKQNQEEQDKINKLLKYKYPYEIATIIPTKTSVTQIKNLAKTTEKKEISFTIPKFLRNDEEQKLTGAQKGTLVHLCLQKLNENEEYNIEKIRKLIQELEEKEIITSVEAKNINPFKILEFTNSDIWKQLKTAKIIKKEKTFYTYISAKEIYNEDVDENVLVQGIIDLYYIDKDDNLILVDYKTDYLEVGQEKELLEKYKEQLELYTRALEESLNRKVDKTYIYSVYLGKSIEKN